MEKVLLQKDLYCNQVEKGLGSLCLVYLASPKYKKANILSGGEWGAYFDTLSARLREFPKKDSGNE